MYENLPREVIAWLLECGIVYDVGIMRYEGIPIHLYRTEGGYRIYIYACGRCSRIATLEGGLPTARWKWHQ